jgi:pilus assembly protein CpaE
MPNRLQVLIAGRPQQTLRMLEQLLEGRPEFACSTRIMTGAQYDVLDGLFARPDVVLLACRDGEVGELETLAAMDPARRPAVIVVGSLTTPEAFRLALRCGATDVLPERPEAAELLAALSRVGRAAREAAAAPASAPAEVVAVVGAAGGVGASFIACNLAHLSVVSDRRRTALVDLDLLYSPLSLFLGLKPERGLLEAVQQIEHLDQMALQGYVATHASGLGLLASAGPAIGADAISAEQFRSLLDLLRQSYGRVVIDAQRWLDNASTMALAEAQNILLVLEQSVAHVHSAARLYRLLTQQLGLPRDRITVILNRYSRRATVHGADVAKALGTADPIELPNEYGLALDSLDAAVPLFEMDRKSPVARALLEVNARIGGAPIAPDSGFLRRALPMFKRSLP